jgi:large subunit ribosomal protein L30
MAELRVKQVRSSNGSNRRQRDTLRSLRLGRIGRQSTVADNAQSRGMLRAVAHLVEVDEEAEG